jgi:nitronate monooxygenase
MQWISKAELAAAVSNAGGIGTVNATSFADKEALRDEIKKMRQLTQKPFIVNISMLPELSLDDKTRSFVDVVLEERVPIVETSGRSPADLVPLFKEQGIKSIHKSASVRHAIKAQEMGVDAVTVVGYECGGHPGMDDVGAFVLFAKASEELTIPVIGGGGISDGKTFYAALALGLDGVIVGTRFMASREAPVHDNVKNMILQAQETDTTLTQRSIRNALRVYKNTAAKEVLEMEAGGCTLEDLMPIITGQRSRQAYIDGEYDNAQISIGQASGRIHSVLSAAEIVAEMVAGAQQARARLEAMF